jgi:histidinol phosphatase-like PHP family hydrolase
VGESVKLKKLSFKSINTNKNTKIAINLHNHTVLSDGKYSPEQIIEEAIRCGLTHVGISDHYATLKISAIPHDELKAYIKHIHSLAERYNDKIKVLTGVEIDSCKERTDFSKIDFGLLGNLDYVLFEYVQDDLWRGMPLWELLEMRKDIDCLVGLAHNDIGKNFAGVGMEALIRVLRIDDVFVELCTSIRYSKFSKPYYHYCPNFFDKLKESRVMISIGTDTHDRLEDVSNISDAVKFIRRLKLENNLISKLF